jgi:hypothetical protein
VHKLSGANFLCIYVLTTHYCGADLYNAYLESPSYGDSNVHTAYRLDYTNFACVGCVINCIRVYIVQLDRVI